MKLTEELNKLQDLKEDVQSAVDTVIMAIDGNEFNGLIPKNPITIEIPEGVEIICGQIDWRFYATFNNGLVYTRLKEVILPSTLKEFHSTLFNILPQYSIKIHFKGDVIPLISSCLDKRSFSRWQELAEEIYRTKGKKREALVNKLLCFMIGVATTRAEFEFDVPIDYSRFDSVEIDL